MQINTQNNRRQLSGHSVDNKTKFLSNVQSREIELQSSSKGRVALERILANFVCISNKSVTK